MDKVTSPIVGLSFLRNNSAVIDITQGLIHFPHLTMTMKTINEENKPRARPVKIQATYIVLPKSDKNNYSTNWRQRTISNDTGTVNPIPPFIRRLQTPSGKLSLDSPKSPNPNKDNKPKRKSVHTQRWHSHSGLHNTNPRTSEVTTTHRHGSAKPTPKTERGDQTTIYINELLKVSNEPQDNFWFPTPQNPGNPETSHRNPETNPKEQYKLMELEQLNPSRDDTSRQQFLDKFRWNDSLLTLEQKESLEDILVDFHDIFARQALSTH